MQPDRPDYLRPARIAAVVDAVISIPLRPFNTDLARRILDKAEELGAEMPTGLDDILSGGFGPFSPGWFLIGLFVSAAMFAAVGALGGVIGVALFGKKADRPAPPPPARPGPPDAA